MKTWKQEFLVMVYICSYTAFRYRGKGHLAYHMRLLHGDSFRSIFQLPSLEAGWWALRRTLKIHGGISMDAQTIQLECPRSLNLCSYDDIQVGFRSCRFKASITLRIDRGITFIIIYVYFMIFIQDIYIYL